MSSYAVLGSTGNVGGAVLKVLLQSPDKIIHAYCRNKDKLLKQNPGIGENKNVRIFEGSLDDEKLLASCIEGTRAVFVTVAVTGNQPGLTIAQDTAHQVVAALEKLRADSTKALPRLVVLSSASTDHRLMSNVPAFLRDALYAAFSFIYDDLKIAEEFYLSKQEWLTTTFIKPGALTHDAQKGHEVNMDTAKTPISFLDLAAGMVEVADSDGPKYNGKGVAVNATSKDVAFPWDSPPLLIKGLIIHYCPWTWKVLG